MRLHVIRRLPAALAPALVSALFGMLPIPVAASPDPGGASAAKPSTAPAREGGEPVRGVTISTHGDGRDWADDETMRATFDDIRALGANWVAIHPYAGIDGNGNVRLWGMSDGPPDWITGPIRQAHAAGLKILIKPHLAYWGSPFKWRGEIDFDSDEKWARFWEGYRSWIVAIARASEGADALVVGTELDKTLGHAEDWRRVIREVREVADIPLTYAANWSDYERVPFWDALDVIGIQAYFPLTDEGATDEAAIRSGWQSWMSRLRSYAAAEGRSVVFTELGYNRALDAPVRPWAYRTDGEEAQEVQERCMRIALAVIEAEPLVVGSFLWKWFPKPFSVGRNFQLATPGMRTVIREAWAPER